MTTPDDATTPPSDEDRPDPREAESRLPEWQRPKQAPPPTPAPPTDHGPAAGSGDDPFARAGTPAEPYSTYRPVYRQPPPGNGWKVATIVLSVIMGLGVLALVGLGVLGFFIASQQLTSSELDDAVASSCEDLTRAASALEPLSAPDAAGDVLDDMADAAFAVAENAEVAASDSTADRRFVRAARDLADALEGLAEDPTEPFELPTRDGTPVTVVMSQGTPSCLVPPVVTALDPDAGDDLIVTEAVPF